LLLALLAFACGPVRETPAGAADCRILLLAGQSNMVGRGRYADLAEGERALPGNVRLYQVALDDRLRPVAGGYLGPEYGLAHALAEADPGATLVLVKYAVDASSLLDWAPDWDPARAAVTGHAEFGPLYDQALAHLAWVQADLDGECTVAAVLWMQGERDARIPEAGAQYRENLENLVRGLRADLGAPDLPFILGQVNPPRERYPAVDAVRSVQAAVARGDPCARLVPSEGLSKHPDGLHYDTGGQIELGRRFAAAYLEIAATQARH